jgi:hypothetical protein
LEFLLAKKPHFGISARFPPLRDEGKPRPYNINVFLVLPMRFPLPLSASDNDLLATLFTKKAQRSVAHLTFASVFRSSWGRGQAPPLQRLAWFGRVICWRAGLFYLAVICHGQNYLSRDISRNIGYIYNGIINAIVDNIKER